MLESPYELLEIGIVERLKGDPRWDWTIYGKDVSPGTKYLLISNVASINSSPKIGQIIEYLISFDAFYTAPSSEGRLTSFGVMGALRTMEKIITLNNHGDEFAPFALDGCVRDISHRNDTPATLDVSSDKSTIRARQVIGFTLSFN